MARKVSEHFTLSHKTTQPAPQRRLRRKDYPVLLTRGYLSSTANPAHQDRSAR